MRKDARPRPDLDARIAALAAAYAARRPAPKGDRCPRCRKRPKGERIGYCRECWNAYHREYQRIMRRLFVGPRRRRGRPAKHGRRAA